MKHLITLMLLMGLLTVAIANEEEDKYTTKYDNIDVDEIISNPRILKNYVNCMLDKGPCTPDGTELKSHVSDALQTDCSKCSEKQKEITDKMLLHLMEKEPDYWKQLQVKYDPSGTFSKKYLESKKN